MVGIADVARHAGVSKATASRALTGSGYVSDNTRSRVQAAAHTLGYVPSTNAVSLATGRTRSVGVIMPYLNRWFFAEVLEGVQEVLLAEGLDLVLYDARPDTEGRRRIFDDFLARKRFDGLIAVGLEPNGQELERLLQIDRPVVSVVGGDSRTSTVAIDDAHAIRRATEHLIALGHTNITFLGGGLMNPPPRVEVARLESFRETMAHAGLEAPHIPSPTTIPGAYAVAVNALSDQRRRPTALLAVSDEVAIGAIIAARRLGLPVPGALSVVGIDDHEYADMFSLTTLAQDPRGQGATAARLLLEQLRNPDAAPETMLLEPQLIIRSSTAPPPGVNEVAVADSGLLAD